MLDDLRNSSTYIDEDEEQNEEEGFAPQRAQRRRQNDRFLGMTAPQRFIISLMLFLMVCVLGSFALVLSGSVILPF